MNNDIVDVRERIVALSTDPAETRALLDRLTDLEVAAAVSESTVHVGKDDVVETKELNGARLHRTKTGFLLHNYGGYDVVVDERMVGTCSALQMLMEGTAAEIPDGLTAEDVEEWNIAVEMVFRLPMFVFGSVETTMFISESAYRYLMFLQKVSEVPTPDSENPEYDRFVAGLSSLFEDLAKGIERQGKEYEERMGSKEE